MALPVETKLGRCDSLPQSWLESPPLVEVSSSVVATTSAQLSNRSSRTGKLVKDGLDFWLLHLIICRDLFYFFCKVWRWCIQQRSNHEHRRARVAQARSHSRLFHIPRRRSHTRARLQHLRVLQTTETFESRCGRTTLQVRKPKHNNKNKLFSNLYFCFFSLMYYNLVGGVLALNLDQLNTTNGYSNLYWGWGKYTWWFYHLNNQIKLPRNYPLEILFLKGAEDDDMSMR